jgi:hypothetical protein
MLLVANKPFFDVATGRRAAGEVFDEPRAKVAAQLLRAGLARELVAPMPARVHYETKVVAPEAPAVSAALPFRDVPNPDPEPPALAALRAAVCAVSDAQKQRDSSLLGWGLDSGPDPAGSETPAPPAEEKHRVQAKRRGRSGKR